MAYADDLKDGDYTGAYGRVCQRVKDRISQENFADSMEREFPVESFTVTGSNVRNFNGVTSATVAMRITRPSGTELP